MVKRTIAIVDTESARRALIAGEISINEHPVFSNTRTEIASRCMKQYALHYILHIPAKITPEVARGDLLHKLMNQLWVVDEKTGILIPGYSSFSAFVNSAKRDWRFLYARPEKTPKGSEIEWKSPGQRRGQWYAGEVANMAGMIYSRFLTEEPRLFSELKIENVQIETSDKQDKLNLMAILDEVRIKRTKEGIQIVIRDHKTGGRNYAKETFLTTNTQMTHYALCLYLALQDKNSLVCKTPELERFRNIKLEDFLENLTVQIHHVSDWRPEGEDHKPVTQLYETTRTMQDIKELIYTLTSRQKSISARDFSQNPLRCPDCFWAKSCKNYDMQAIFNNEDEERLPLFANAGLVVKTTCGQKIKPAVTQKPFRLQYKKGGIVCEGTIKP